MPNEVKSNLFFRNHLDKELYDTLSDEEKENIMFLNSCISSEDIRIKNAANDIMSFLVDIDLDPNKYAPEDIPEITEGFFKNLSEEETKIMNKFLLSCINSRGVTNKESEKQRKLIKKEGMIKNGKS